MSGKSASNKNLRVLIAVGIFLAICAIMTMVFGTPGGGACIGVGELGSLSGGNIVVAAQGNNCVYGGYGSVNGSKLATVAKCTPNSDWTDSGIVFVEGGNLSLEITGTINTGATLNSKWNIDATQAGIAWSIPSISLGDYLSLNIDPRSNVFSPSNKMSLYTQGASGPVGPIATSPICESGNTYFPGCWNANGMGVQFSIATKPVSDASNTFGCQASNSVFYSAPIVATNPPKASCAAGAVAMQPTTCYPYNKNCDGDVIITGGDPAQVCHKSCGCNIFGTNCSYCDYYSLRLPAVNCSFGNDGDICLFATPTPELVDNGAIKAVYELYLSWTCNNGAWTPNPYGATSPINPNSVSITTCQNNCPDLPVHNSIADSTNPIVFSPNSCPGQSPVSLTNNLHYLHQSKNSIMFYNTNGMSYNSATAGLVMASSVDAGSLQYSIPLPLTGVNNSPSIQSPYIIQPQGGYGTLVNLLPKAASITNNMPATSDSSQLLEVVVLDNQGKQVSEVLTTTAGSSYKGVIAPLNGSGYKSGTLGFRIGSRTLDSTKMIGQYYVTVNQTGGLNNTVATDVSTGNMASGIIKKIIAPVQTQLSFASAVMYNNIATNAYLAKIVNSMLVLYIIIYAVFFMFGLVEISQNDLIIRIAKIGTVLTVISPNSWAFFNDHLFSLFQKGSIFLLQSVVNVHDLSGSANVDEQFTATILAVVDNTIGYFFTSTVWMKLVSLLTSPFGWPYFFVFLYSMQTFAWVVLEAVVAYIFSMIAIAFMIALAPLFLICVLYDRTKELFNSWLKYLFSFALQPVLLFFLILSFYQVYTSIFFNAIAFPACWNCILNISKIGALPLPEFCILSFFVPSDLDGGSNVGNFIKEVVPSCLMLIMMAKLMKGLNDLAPQIVERIIGTLNTALSGKNSVARDMVEKVRDVAKKATGQDEDSKQRRQNRATIAKHEAKKDS